MGQHCRTGIWLLTSLLALGWGSGFTSAAAAVTESAPVAAARGEGAGPAPSRNLITCWYNASKQYTGADGANPGTHAGGPALTGNGGDYTWAYTIAAPDGSSCPHTMPAPAAPKSANLITCWYNASKQYTGADGASPGTHAGGPVRTGNGGDYTWAYTIAAPDGSSCPHNMPAPHKKGRR